jgi:predicted dehydrogenase
MPAASHREFRWAVLGPGRIARRFAQAVREIPDARMAVVIGRDEQRAREFADAWCEPDATRVGTDLTELLRTRDVDAVYIATPHAFHAEQAARCLRAGVPVLCEKPLTVNLGQARALDALSRTLDVFLMEALWTRFLPVYETVGEWLREGRIGAVRAIQSSFGFPVPFDAKTRHWDPWQAGGALLDIGVYNLSMARWALAQATGAAPELEDFVAEAKLAPSGVDAATLATLRFSGDVHLQFRCGFDALADNSLRIFGERGLITVPARFWEATTAVLQPDGGEPVQVERPFAINGFEGEIVEAMACIRGGRRESARLPLSETLAVTGWSDAIRQHVGLRYPLE